jgi:GMP synthase-like glutamine amidotransferase
VASPILVLRHEPFEHLGHFAAALDSAGAPFEYRDLGAPLSLGEAPGVIIMGGPQSANDSLPGLRAELALIDDALKAGVPMLGICLGSQLIAKALGARVYRNGQKEIGWFPVRFTESAAGDPMFSSFQSPMNFFHWHGETFDLPEGACWLAYSEKTRHQAFRFSSNVYGLQFHPEVTPEMISDWCQQPANCGDSDAMPALFGSHAEDLRPSAQKIVEGWLGRA